MDIKYGNGSSQYGPGVSVEMTGDELAMAVDAWLESQGLLIAGPRTVRVNGARCESAHVYVDPSGAVLARGRHYSGRGPKATLTAPGETEA